MKVARQKDEWAALDVAFDSYAKSFYELAKQVHKFCKEDGEKQQAVADRYDISKAAVSMMVAVGGEQRLFNIVKHLLPRDTLVAYKLTQCTDAEFHEAFAEGRPTRAVVDSILAKRPPAIPYQVPQIAVRTPTVAPPKHVQRAVQRNSASTMGFHDALELFGVSGAVITLSEQCINILYRGFASLNHPDKGGSNKLMMQTTEARDLLRRHYGYSD